MPGSIPHVNPGDPVDASLENAQTDAINQTTAILGSNPSGPYSTVTEAIASMDNSTNCGRVTLTSVGTGGNGTSTGVPMSDVIGATTVYFTPFRGNRIALYDGSSAWRIKTFSQLSLALGTLVSGKNYDLFVWNNAGTVTLSLGTPWFSDNARISGAAGEITLQDGVWVNHFQDGSIPALQGRLVGVIRTTSTTTTEDSYAKRFTWSHSNRVVRPGVFTGSNYSAAPTPDSWVTLGARSAFVVGILDQYVSGAACGRQMSNDSVGDYTRIGWSQNNGALVDGLQYIEMIKLVGSTNNAVVPAHLTPTPFAPLLGYNYLDAWVKTINGGIATVTQPSTLFWLQG